MNNITFDKNGNITFPMPGKMKITVEMTEDIFEEFMQFRKDREKYILQAARQTDGIKAKMNNLSRAVLEYFNTKSVKDKAAAKEEAIEAANDWFA